MKHKWQKLKSGEINNSALSEGYHNGPVCVECGHSFCEHCQPEEWESECLGRPGFKFRIRFEPFNFVVGFFWNHPCKVFALRIFPMVTLIFDFSGLFPYCEEIKSYD